MDPATAPAAGKKIGGSIKLDNMHPFLKYVWEPGLFGPVPKLKRRVFNSGSELSPIHTPAATFQSFLLRLRSCANSGLGEWKIKCQLSKYGL